MYQSKVKHYNNVYTFIPCSMDGFRVVRLDDIAATADIVITATGTVCTCTCTTNVHIHVHVCVYLHVCGINVHY